MFNPNDYRGNNQGVFMSSINGLTITLAVIVTIGAAPWLYSVTAEMVAVLAYKVYGPDWVDLILLVWNIALYPLCFYAIRASLVVAISGAALTVAMRYV